MAFTGIDPVPSIGRIVIYEPTKDDRGNSSSESGFPAIITRVWSPTCVNLMVFRDYDTPIAVTSVEKQSAPAEGLPHGTQLMSPRSWRWPERV